MILNLPFLIILPEEDRSIVSGCWSSAPALRPSSNAAPYQAIIGKLCYFGRGAKGAGSHEEGCQGHQRGHGQDMGQEQQWGARAPHVVSSSLGRGAVLGWHHELPAGATASRCSCSGAGPMSVRCMSSRSDLEIMSGGA